ncbi:hypothetical protein Leryth_019779 [Lithospermum erythrorhizon]|nr:hypothetical protein Leryth_019779 [Lithospermum erythrorhizon]
MQHEASFITSPINIIFIFIHLRQKATNSIPFCYTQIMALLSQLCLNVTPTVYSDPSILPSDKHGSTLSFFKKRTTFSSLRLSALTNSNKHQTPSSSFSELIENLISGVDLSEAEAERSLDFLLNDADEALISAFLVLLRAKGETFEEIGFQI